MPPNYSVSIQAERGRNLHRVPQLSTVLRIVLSDVQLEWLLQKGAIELTVPEEQAKPFEAAFQPHK